jgi:DNA-binding transcriptional MocR family regulator
MRPGYVVDRAQIAQFGVRGAVARVGSGSKVVQPGVGIGWAMTAGPSRAVLLGRAERVVLPMALAATS